MATNPKVGGGITYDRLVQIAKGAGAAYDVPWQVLVAISKIESNYGRNQGPSSAGAIGWMQFLPSTWKAYGVDATGDGKADPHNPSDAIYSAANLLHANGASTDLHKAIFSYNHADWYVNQVVDLATQIGGPPTDGAGKPSQGSHVNWGAIASDAAKSAGGALIPGLGLGIAAADAGGGVVKGAKGLIGGVAGIPGVITSIPGAIEDAGSALLEGILRVALAALTLGLAAALFYFGIRRLSGDRLPSPSQAAGAAALAA